MPTQWTVNIGRHDTSDKTRRDELDAIKLGQSLQSTSAVDIEYCTRLLSFYKKTTLSIIVNEANKTLKLNEEKIFPVEQETI